MSPLVQAKHLAWHETLEIHELTAMTSHNLMALKKNYRKVTDPRLKELYTLSIQALQKNLRDLVRFLPMAPAVAEGAERNETAFYGGDLLMMSKTAVRNYALALTESATSEVRAVLKRHLEEAVAWHEMVYTFMYEKGYYPSYDINKLLQNDAQNAQKALDMGY